MSMHLPTGSVMEHQGRGREHKPRQKASDSIASGFMVSPQFSQNTLFQPWGLDNKFPYHWMNLLEQNPIVEGLLGKVVSFGTGSDYYLYRQIKSGEKVKKDFISESEHAEIWDWLDENDWQTLSMKVLTDWSFLGKAVVELIPNKTKTKIIKANHIDTTLHRIGRFTWKPETHVFADWQTGIYNIERAKPDFSEQNRYVTSVLMLGQYKPGQYRYSTPFYVGAEKAIELLNKTFLFHLGGLNNGYLIRYHISVPSDYFEGIPNKTPEEAEEEFQEMIDMLLSRPENSGKSLITFFETDLQNNKAKDGVKIEPIQTNLYDKAFVDIFNQAQVSICSAIGMNPELGGVIMQGSMSGNSGSGIRNAHNHYVNTDVHTIRNWTLNKLFRTVSRANGWDSNIYLGFVDYNIQKLDDEPQGGNLVTS